MENSAVTRQPRDKIWYYKRRQPAVVFSIMYICTEAEFLDVIGAKFSRVFLLAIHSHLY
jgi:hypothetical protein